MFNQQFRRHVSNAAFRLELTANEIKTLLHYSEAKRCSCVLTGGSKISLAGKGLVVMKDNEVVRVTVAGHRVAELLEMAGYAEEEQR